MFRTAISPSPAPKKITHTAPVLSIGSCFSDCIGKQLANYKFPVMANPYGTVYNPVSIFKLLTYTHDKHYPAIETYLENQGLHANYDFHSRFSEIKQEDLSQNIHQSIDEAHTFYDKCEWLIITFGTAFTYMRKDNGEIVANCHKVPLKHFEKSLLSTEEIVDAFKNWYTKQSDRLNIILTVSPVRHIKDTLEQNAVSKAILRVACDQLTKAYKNVHYFPSYELMMDDLRDYRFYKADMLHPSEEAETYIWQKFSASYFDKETLTFLIEWEKIRKALNHKPFNPHSESHRKFVKETIEKLKALEGKVDVSEELTQLKN